MANVKTYLTNYWFQSYDNRGIAIDAPRGYLQVGDEREVFYEFDISAYDPVVNDYSANMAVTELWINGNKITSDKKLYSTGQIPSNIGYFKLAFDASGTYNIELRGQNTLSFSVYIRPNANIPDVSLTTVSTGSKSGVATNVATIGSALSNINLRSYSNTGISDYSSRVTAPTYTKTQAVIDALNNIDDLELTNIDDPSYNPLDFLSNLNPLNLLDGLTGGNSNRQQTATKTTTTTQVVNSSNNTIDTIKNYAPYALAGFVTFGVLYIFATQSNLIPTRSLKQKYSDL